MSKFVVWCSGIQDQLEIARSNVEIGFYHEIFFFWEYFVVALSKFSTDSNRSCQNIGDSKFAWTCKTDEKQLVLKFQGPQTKT